MFDMLVGGLGSFFGFDQILYTNVGVFLGLLIGVLPGLGPLLGMVLFIPLAIHLSTVAGMGLLIGIMLGGSCGGAITGILLNIPGTPIAAATVIDGYPMGRKGKAPEAVGLSIAASSLGGLLGGVALMFFSPPLAAMALKFGPPEYFALAISGIISISLVARESTIKGLISGCLGLLLGAVGTDPFTGYDRFTFGYAPLMGGIDLVAMLIGVYGVTEVFFAIEEGGMNLKPKIQIFWAPWRSAWVVLRKFGCLARSSVIGVIIGALPGTGAVAAAFISYAMAKASSDKPEEFGTGKEEGVIAAESADNASLGGALIPTLALAIPGDPMTAVLLGAFMLVGLLPGPELFRNNPEVVGGVIWAYMFGNIFLFILGLLFTPFLVSLLKIRKNRLMPAVAMLCIVGVYGLQQTLFDVWCMWIFGFVGYYFRKLDVPLAPLVIAKVLGPIIEPAFRRSLILSAGSFNIFIIRPICLGILILNVFLLVWISVSPITRKRLKEKILRKIAGKRRESERGGSKPILD